MTKSYIAPTIIVAGSVLGRTEITGSPPDAEVLFKNESAGSVGFGL